MENNDFNLEAMTINTLDENSQVDERGITTTIIWTVTISIQTTTGTVPYTGPYNS